MEGKFGDPIQIKYQGSTTQNFKDKVGQDIQVDFNILLKNLNQNTTESVLTRLDKVWLLNKFKTFLI